MSTTSPATPSNLSPFGKSQKHPGRGNAYGRSPTWVPPGHRRPQPKVSGLDTAGMMQWAKDNKWYLLGGALILGAGIALATSKR